VLLPRNYASSCVVTVDEERKTMYARANGDRPHYRYSRPGPSMCGGNRCAAYVDCPGIKIMYDIPNPNRRCE
jgi:hypothetical protein